MLEQSSLCSATYVLCTPAYFELCYTMVITAKAIVATSTTSSPLLADSISNCASALISPYTTCIKRVSVMSYRNLDYSHPRVLPCQLTSGKLKSPVRARICDTEASSSALKKASPASLLDRHTPTIVSPLLA